jgi:hypothetical protein
MAMEPHIVEADNVRNGRLAQEEKEVLQVRLITCLSYMLTAMF